MKLKYFCVLMLVLCCGSAAWADQVLITATNGTSTVNVGLFVYNYDSGAGVLRFDVSNLTMFGSQDFPVTDNVTFLNPQLTIDGVADGGFTVGGVLLSNPSVPPFDATVAGSSTNFATSSVFHQAIFTATLDLSGGSTFNVNTFDAMGNPTGSTLFTASPVTISATLGSSPTGPPLVPEGVSAVPEPSFTLALIGGIGALSLTGRRYLRRG